MSAADLGLIDRPLRSVATERLQLPPGSRTQIAKLTGSGTVVEIFIALGSTVGGVGPAVDTILEISRPCCDGPDVSIDLGTLFASHFAQNAGLRMSGGSAHVEMLPGGTGAGYVLTLPVPYDDGLVVALVNPGGETPLAYTEVVFSPGWNPTPGLVLTSTGRTWPARANVNVNDAAELASFTGDGWIVWSSIVGIGASPGVAGRSWLERNVQVFDGSGAMLFGSSGLEDWFAGSYYFQDRRSYGTPWSLVGENKVPERINAAAVDLRALLGGIRYTGGARVVLTAERPYCSTSHSMSWCVLAYRELGS